jgi:peptide/nickel transport system permease protein
MTNAAQANAPATAGASQFNFGTNRFAGVTRFLKRNPVGFFAGVICMVLLLVAAAGPMLAPHDPALTTFPRLEAPSWTYPLGTDNLFRDMLSRIIVGARNSLGIGLTAVGFATVLGTSLGILSGYLAGRTDMIISRLIEVLLAFPALVFLIFLLSIFNPSYTTVAIAIGLVLTPSTTRVVRGATIGVRSQQYIEAAIAIGNSPLRIMWKHVLPNITAPVIVIASIQIGGAILAEASISFLGLGVSTPENPSWGSMLQETRVVWQTAWWTAVVPGLAISIAVLSFNIFGDALRDTLDPRLRGSR